jgi:hypothetical protein
MQRPTCRLLYPFAFIMLLTGCDSFGDKELSFPKRDELQRAEGRGKITGEGGLDLFGGGSSDSSSGGGANPLGVNAFLWRATLDTLSFLPLRDADPFGGVVITDWYEDPAARGERYKVSALILDKSLRADGIQVSLFKQQRDSNGEWADIDVPDRLERKLEDTILTRARELRVTGL